MARNRFTPSEVDRLPLSDGDWIEVKRYLNNGDAKKHDAAGLNPPMVVNGKVVRPIDWERYELERAAIYLVDWSFRDANDKPMPLRTKDGRVDMDMLRALEPEDFDEINDAIIANAIKRADEKNALRVKANQTTPSPDSDQTS